MTKKFTCPYCKKEWFILDTAVGKPVTCTNCGCRTRTVEQFLSDPDTRPDTRDDLPAFNPIELTQVPHEAAPGDSDTLPARPKIKSVDALPKLNLKEESGPDG